MLATAVAVGYTAAPGSATSVSKSQPLVFNLEPVIFPYVSANNQGINSEAKLLNIKVNYANANGSTETQVSQINTAVAAHPAAIIIQATDSVGVLPAVKRAISAGICVVVGQVSLGPTGTVYPGTKGYVGWNEYDSGTYAGEALAKAVGYKGDIAIQVGSLTSNSEQAHVAAAEKVWKKYPGLHMINLTQNQYDANTARSDALALISRYGSALKGIFVGQNPSAVAVITAIDATAEKGKIAIVSIGGERQYQALVDKGLAAADVPQVPVSEGQAEVQLANQCIHGNRNPVDLLEENLPSMEPLAKFNYTLTEADSGVAKFTPQW